MKYEDEIAAPGARELYERRLKLMSPQQKLKMISRLRERARAVVRAGVKAQHPEYTAEQMHAEIKRRLSSWSS
ncbi:MAG: hypothetical protein ABFD96_20850 [Armatimonadia bacterium]